MRSFLAHGLAILGMLPVLFVAFILMLDGGKLSSDAYGFAIIYMAFFGPVVLIATLVYYAIFRAGNFAIWALLVMAGAILLALPFQFMHDIFGLWLLIFLAGIAAALTHHLIIRLLRRWTAKAQPVS